MRHHRLTDRFGGDLAFADALKLAHDLRHHLINLLRIDRPFAQRDLHRPQELVAVERHAPAIALDHNQFAQLHPLECCETEIATQTDPAAADDGRILGRPRILHLGIEACTTRAPHPLSLVDRESADQTFHLFGYPLFGLDVLFKAPAQQRIKYFSAHIANLPEFGDAEAPRRAGRRAEPHPRGDRGLFRIEWNAVLVAGYVRAPQRRFRNL